MWYTDENKLVIYYQIVDEHEVKTNKLESMQRQASHCW
jgi:hypothetical protein